MVLDLFHLSKSKQLFRTLELSNGKLFYETDFDWKCQIEIAKTKKRNPSI